MNEQVLISTYRFRARTKDPLTMTIVPKIADELNMPEEEICEALKLLHYLGLVELSRSFGKRGSYDNLCVELTQKGKGLVSQRWL